MLRIYPVIEIADGAQWPFPPAALGRRSLHPPTPLSRRPMRRRAMARRERAIGARIVRGEALGASVAALARMLWALTILLLFLWVLGFATSSQVGAWIHILLVLALVLVVVNLIRGRSAV